MTENAQATLDTLALEKDNIRINFIYRVRRRTRAPSNTQSTLLQFKNRVRRKTRASNLMAKRLFKFNIVYDGEREHRVHQVPFYSVKYYTPTCVFIYRVRRRTRASSSTPSNQLQYYTPVPIIIIDMANMPTLRMTTLSKHDTFDTCAHERQVLVYISSTHHADDQAHAGALRGAGARDGGTISCAIRV